MAPSLKRASSARPSEASRTDAVSRSRIASVALTVVRSRSSRGSHSAAIAALAEGGVAFMPIAETFWAKRFGMCVDRFGTPWMVNCEKAM